MPVLKKIPFPAYCLLLTAYLVISCHADSPAEKKSYGDTIVVGWLQRFSSINPVLSVSSVSSELESIIFDGLIKIDEKGEPQPNLASSWKVSENGLTWTFYLRKGVKFHDGKELTAEDVVFTYKAVKNPKNKGNYSSYFELVKEIRVVDKYTIEITLKKPYASFLYGIGVGILPKHLLESESLHNTEFNYNPVGTGHYKLKSWNENEIILMANEDYFNGRPYLNRIIIKSFPNQKVMWARLMRGEIDFSPAITPSDYKIIKDIPSFKTYSVLKPYYYMIVFNLMEKGFNVEIASPEPALSDKTKIASASPRNDRSEGARNDRNEGAINNKQGKGVIARTLSREKRTKQSMFKGNLFKDKRIRQALNYAIDKEKIIHDVLEGMGKVSAGTVYPLSWAYYQDIKPYPYNPQKALILLKEAGWEDRDNNHFLDKDGKELSFTVLINKGDKIKERCARLIQEQLFDIGVKLEVKLIELDFLIENLLKGDFESTLMEGVSINDPDINYQFWHSSQIAQGFNVFSYKNQMVDELLDNGRITFDREKRKGYYDDFQKEILDDPPGIFLFWTEYLVGIHERFKDVKVDWRGTFANITDWHVPEGKQRYKQ